MAESESLAREDGREVREPPAPLESWIAEHNAERVARGEHERGWFGSRLAYMGENEGKYLQNYLYCFSLFPLYVFFFFL